MPDLSREIQAFNEKRAEITEKFAGRFVVLKNGIVIGDFEDRFRAVTETNRIHPPGSFLVQYVSEVEPTNARLNSLHRPSHRR